MKICFCSDINECEDNTHGCDSHGTCQNIKGSYVCECDTGYSHSLFESQLCTGKTYCSVCVFFRLQVSTLKNQITNVKIGDKTKTVLLKGSKIVDLADC